MNKKFSIIVCGAGGRVGAKIIERIAKAGQFSLFGAVDIAGGENISSPEEFENLIAKADIAIDFTSPKASLRFAKICAKARKPIVIGTTGFTNEELSDLKNCANEAPVFLSPNMSPAVNLTFAVSKLIAKKLKNFDISILEAHHIMKKDAPSGTALRYRDYIMEVSDKKIDMASVRAGGIIGEHTVLFAGSDERVELTHRAQSRDVFAKGALEAAKWTAVQKPGFYNFFDMFDLKDIV
ncbi:MAG: 4-hydroxy-tetrahydrodipicolinate reductase [Elusimicrobiota bacterium]|nr:4-hydroxy-tetrahydrodipicolinate reductase [Elusimicrobiota bacterium]